MRVAVLTYGTRGDVQPYLAVADRLRSRGHDVVLTVTTNLADMARAAGFEVVTIPVDSQAFMEGEEGRRFLSSGKTTKFLAEAAKVETAARDGFDAALVEATVGADVIVGTVLTAVRAACIREATGQPLVVANTVPTEPTGDYPSPYLVPGALPGRHLRRLSHRAFAVAYWKGARGNVNAMRERLSLPPARASARRGLDPLLAPASPVTHLASPVLLPRPVDWPAHLSVAGSVATPPSLRADWGEGEVPPALEGWLDDGSPPVYFGFGSMPVLDPAATMASIADVAERLQVRALVCAGWSAFAPGPSATSDRMFLVGAMDHDRVLPRCRAAVVHRGGAGTTHTVLRAGVPALVVHVFADQRLWGWRVRDLEVGATLPYTKLDTASLYTRLAPLLAPAVKERAERLGSIMALEDGAGAAADLVEATAARG